jgi:hypothetical protein
VAPSSFLPACTAYIFINVSPQPLQPQDAHLPPSKYTCTFLFPSYFSVHYITLATFFPRDRK